MLDRFSSTIGTTAAAESGEHVGPAKKYCQFRTQAEDRIAMNEPLRSRAGACVSVLLGLAFAWTLALSVAPQLHERIHPDANRVEHSCAVTFVASGTYEHSAPPPVLPQPVATTVSRVAVLNPTWILSAFLSASIFEHAPPRFA